jgi:hypothetical protein
VVPAVQLHDDSRFRAAEIHDEWADRMLTAELEACQAPVSEKKPQLSFRTRL